MVSRSFTRLMNESRPTRCIDGRLWRHYPQADDPYLEIDVGPCPGCEECDPESMEEEKE